MFRLKPSVVAFSRLAYETNVCVVFSNVKNMFHKTGHI